MLIFRLHAGFARLHGLIPESVDTVTKIDGDKFYLCRTRRNPCYSSNRCCIFDRLMGSKILILWLPVASVLLAGSVSANDLIDLYRLALTRDATIHAAGFKRDAAIEARPQALQPLFPELSVDASVVRERAGYNPLLSNGTSGVDCAIVESSTSSHCYGTARSLGIGVSQVLWNIHDFYALKTANALAAAAEVTFLSSQQSLILRVAQAYFGFLSSVDRLTIARAEREAFGKLLHQARVREEAGLRPHSDVAQVLAFYDSTEQEVIDAEDVLADARLSLAVIVGSRSEDLAPLRNEFPLSAPQPASADDWAAAALVNNLDVRAAQLQVDAASKEISAQRGKYWPTVALGLSDSKLRQDAVLGGNQTLDTGGLYFHWSLYQGGAVASGIRQARAQWSEAEGNLDGLRRKTDQQTRSAYRHVESGVQRIIAARRAVESGGGALEASRRNVEFATGTEFDLLNAQSNLFAAERTSNQVRYDYLTNVLLLKQLAGTLTERDLSAVDDMLVDRRP